MKAQAPADERHERKTPSNGGRRRENGEPGGNANPTRGAVYGAIISTRSKRCFVWNKASKSRRMEVELVSAGKHPYANGMGEVASDEEGTLHEERSP